MIGFHNTQQLRELFLAGGMGFLLGAYYDVFRVWRCIKCANAWQVFWQDVLFFVTSAAAVFVFALAVTDGVLRVYLYVGLIAGFAAYRYTVGRAVVGAVTLVCRVLSRMAARVRHRVGEAWAFVAKKVQKNIKKFKKGIATETESGV